MALENSRYSPTEDQELRHVNLDGYTLKTWDTYRTDRMGKSTLGYTFRKPDGAILFEGEDFHVGMSTAIDSDEALRSLLGFLTLAPGDTDAEYFEKYTPAQLAFAEGPAEDLQTWGMDPEDFGEDAPVFVDVTPADD